MFIRNHGWWCALTVAAVTSLPTDTEAQTGARSFGGIRWNVTEPVYAIANARREDRRGTRDGSPFSRSPSLSKSSVPTSQRTDTPKRSWIKRHPVLLGTLVGFGGGFAV